MEKPTIYLVGDTENTVPGGVHTSKDLRDFKTEIWCCGYGEVGKDKVYLFGNIEKMLNDVVRKYGKNYKVVFYFHNLAWDGTLLLSELCARYKYTRASNPWKLGDKQFSTMISDKGQWYTLKIKWRKCQITFRDSLKILPFSVDAIAKSFETKHQKLKGTIDYSVDRHRNWALSDEERRYVENDIYVMQEALEMVKPYGLLDHLTIGSTCLDNYKQIMGKTYKVLFPPLTPELDGEIRKAYRGGWCYVNPKIENKPLYNVAGYTYDVNSLYPYVMHTTTFQGEQRHVYPVGNCAAHFQGEDFEKYKGSCYFVKINVDFGIKENHLPFIQIKHSRFKDNEYLKDSSGVVQITLAKPDYELLHEQYHIFYEEIVEGWAFAGREGIFDQYIDYWFKVKAEATRTGNKVLRQLAKLFLNNLYGKMATSLSADSKVPSYCEEDGLLHWEVIHDTKNGVYIPAGAFITAYARCKTVRAAQENYDKFCYADTDSIHCTGQATGIEIDPVALGAWDNEAKWNQARFVRQKTYIEKIGDRWNVKACGAPDIVKERLLYKVGIDEGLEKDEEGNIKNEKYTDKEFMERFTFGLVESGKLSRKTVQGGVILFNTTFSLMKV